MTPKTNRTENIKRNLNAWKHAEIVATRKLYRAEYKREAQHLRAVLLHVGSGVEANAEYVAGLCATVADLAAATEILDATLGLAAHIK